MNKGLFLDRDGVINHDYSHVHEISKFIFRDEIFDIASCAVKLRFKIVVVTNQGGIGRGLYSFDQFAALNEYMIKSFMDKNIVVDKVYYCAYHPIHGKGYFKRQSFFRKPNPGMIIQACNELNINPKYSVMIGDQETDRQAAYRANVSRYVDANSPEWGKTAMNALNF